MPKVTIWIRNEDYDKWKAIDNKPAWLHEHLNGEDGVLGSSQPQVLSPQADAMLNADVLRDRIDEPKLTPPEEAA